MKISIVILAFVLVTSQLGNTSPTISNVPASIVETGLPNLDADADIKKLEDDSEKNKKTVVLLVPVESTEANYENQNEGKEEEEETEDVDDITQRNHKTKRCKSLSSSRTVRRIPTAKDSRKYITVSTESSIDENLKHPIAGRSLFRVATAKDAKKILKSLLKSRLTRQEDNDAMSERVSKPNNQDSIRLVSQDLDEPGENRPKKYVCYCVKDDCGMKKPGKKSFRPYAVKKRIGPNILSKSSYSTNDENQEEISKTLNSENVLGAPNNLRCPPGSILMEEPKYLAQLSTNQQNQEQYLQRNPVKKCSQTNFPYDSEVHSLGQPTKIHIPLADNRKLNRRVYKIDRKLPFVQKLQSLIEQKENQDKLPCPEPESNFNDAQGVQDYYNNEKNNFNQYHQIPLAPNLVYPGPYVVYPQFSQYSQYDDNVNNQIPLDPANQAFVGHQEPSENQYVPTQLGSNSVDLDQCIKLFGPNFCIVTTTTISPNNNVPEYASNCNDDHEEQGIVAQWQDDTHYTTESPQKKTSRYPTNAYNSDKATTHFHGLEMTQDDEEKLHQSEEYQEDRYKQQQGDHIESEPRYNHVTTSPYYFYGTTGSKQELGSETPIKQINPNSEYFVPTKDSYESETVDYTGNTEVLQKISKENVTELPVDAITKISQDLQGAHRISSPLYVEYTVKPSEEDVRTSSSEDSEDTSEYIQTTQDSRLANYDRSEFRFSTNGPSNEESNEFTTESPRTIIVKMDKPEDDFRTTLRTGSQKVSGIPGWQRFTTVYPIVDSEIHKASTSLGMYGPINRNNENAVPSKYDVYHSAAPEQAKADLMPHLQKTTSSHRQFVEFTKSTPVDYYSKPKFVSSSVTGDNSHYATSYETMENDKYSTTSLLGENKPQEYKHTSLTYSNRNDAVEMKTESSWPQKIEENYENSSEKIPISLHYTTQSRLGNTADDKYSTKKMQSYLQPKQFESNVKPTVTKTTTSHRKFTGKPQSISMDNFSKPGLAPSATVGGNNRYTTSYATIEKSKYDTTPLLEANEPEESVFTSDSPVETKGDGSVSSWQRKTEENEEINTEKVPTTLHYITQSRLGDTADEKYSTKKMQSYLHPKQSESNVKPTVTKTKTSHQKFTGRPQSISMDNFSKPGLAPSATVGGNNRYTTSYATIENSRHDTTPLFEANEPEERVFTSYSPYSTTVKTEGDGPASSWLRKIEENEEINTEKVPTILHYTMQSRLGDTADEKYSTKKMQSYLQPKKSESNVKPTVTKTTTSHRKFTGRPQSIFVDNFSKPGLAPSATVSGNNRYTTSYATIENSRYDTTPLLEANEPEESAFTSYPFYSTIVETEGDGSASSGQRIIEENEEINTKKVPTTQSESNVKPTLTKTKTSHQKFTGRPQSIFVDNFSKPELASSATVGGNNRYTTSYATIEKSKYDTTPLLEANEPEDRVFTPYSPYSTTVETEEDGSASSWQQKIEENEEINTEKVPTNLYYTTQSRLGDTTDDKYSTKKMKSYLQPKQSESNVKPTVTKTTTSHRKFTGRPQSISVDNFSKPGLASSATVGGNNRYTTSYATIKNSKYDTTPLLEANEPEERVFTSYSPYSTAVETEGGKSTLPWQQKIEKNEEINTEKVPSTPYYTARSEAVNRDQNNWSRVGKITNSHRKFAEKSQMTPIDDFSQSGVVSTARIGDNSYYTTSHATMEDTGHLTTSVLGAEEPEEGIFSLTTYPTIHGVKEMKTGFSWPQEYEEKHQDNIKETQWTQNYPTRSGIQDANLHQHFTTVKSSYSQFDTKLPEDFTNSYNDAYSRNWYYSTTNQPATKDKNIHRQLVASHHSTPAEMVTISTKSDLQKMPATDSSKTYWFPTTERHFPTQSERPFAIVNHRTTTEEENLDSKMSSEDDIYSNEDITNRYPTTEAILKDTMVTKNAYTISGTDDNIRDEYQTPSEASNILFVSSEDKNNEKPKNTLEKSFKQSGLTPSVETKSDIKEEANAYFTSMSYDDNVDAVTSPDSYFEGGGIKNWNNFMSMSSDDSTIDDVNKVEGIKEPTNMVSEKEELQTTDIPQSHTMDYEAVGEELSHKKSTLNDDFSEETRYTTEDHHLSSTKTPTQITNENAKEHPGKPHEHKDLAMGSNERSGEEEEVVEKPINQFDSNTPISVTHHFGSKSTSPKVLQNENKVLDKSLTQHFNTDHSITNQYSQSVVTEESDRQKPEVATVIGKTNEFDYNDYNNNLSTTKNEEENSSVISSTEDYLINIDNNLSGMQQTLPHNVVDHTLHKDNKIISTPISSVTESSENVETLFSNKRIMQADDITKKISNLGQSTTSYERVGNVFGTTTIPEDESNKKASIADKTKLPLEDYEYTNNYSSLKKSPTTEFSKYQDNVTLQPLGSQSSSDTVVTSSSNNYEDDMSSEADLSSKSIESIGPSINETTSNLLKSSSTTKSVNYYYADFGTTQEIALKPNNIQEKTSTTLDTSEKISNVDQLSPKDRKILRTTVEKVVNDIISAKIDKSDRNSPVSPDVVGASSDGLQPGLPESPILKNFFSLPIVKDMAVNTVKGLISEVSGVPEYSSLGRLADNLIDSVLDGVVNNVLHGPVTTASSRIVDKHRFEKSRIASHKIVPTVRTMTMAPGIKKPSGPFKNMPAIPVVEHVFKNGKWSEKQTFLGDKKKHFESTSSSYKTPENQFGFTTKAADYALIGESEEDGKFTQEKVSSSGIVGMTDNFSTIGKTPHDNEEDLDNAPIKYYSPNDRILSYIKNHQTPARIVGSEEKSQTTPTHIGESTENSWTSSEVESNELSVTTDDDSVEFAQTTKAGNGGFSTDFEVSNIGSTKKSKICICEEEEKINHERVASGLLGSTEVSNEEENYSKLPTNIHDLDEYDESTTKNDVGKENSLTSMESQINSGEKFISTESSEFSNTIHHLEVNDEGSNDYTTEESFENEYPSSTEDSERNKEKVEDTKSEESSEEIKALNVTTDSNDSTVFLNTEEDNENIHNQIYSTPEEDQSRSDEEIEESTNKEYIDVANVLTTEKFDKNSEEIETSNEATESNESRTFSDVTKEILEANNHRHIDQSVATPANEKDVTKNWDEIATQNSRHQFPDASKHNGFTDHATTSTFQETEKNIGNTQIPELHSVSHLHEGNDGQPEESITEDYIKLNNVLTTDNSEENSGVEASTEDTKSNESFSDVTSEILQAVSNENADDNSSTRLNTYNVPVQESTTQALGHELTKISKNYGSIEEATTSSPGLTGAARSLVGKPRLPSHPHKQFDSPRGNIVNEASTSLNYSSKCVTSKYDPTYFGKISLDGVNPGGDTISDLTNKNLFYVGDGVKIPLTIQKTPDGSYALSISEKICENFVKRKCPCCVPREGNIVEERRQSNEADDEEYSAETTSKGDYKYDLFEATESTEIQEKLKKRYVRSTSGNEVVVTSATPVKNFVKKYNLTLNLEEDTSPLDIQGNNEKTDGMKNIRRKSRLSSTRDTKILNLFGNNNEIRRDDSDENEKRAIDDDNVDTVSKESNSIRRAEYTYETDTNDFVQSLLHINDVPEDKRAEIVLNALDGLVNSVSGKNPSPMDRYNFGNSIEDESLKDQSQISDDYNLDEMENEMVRYGYQKDNPILERIRFIKAQENSHGQYKYQKNIDHGAKGKMNILKTVLHWLREIFLETKSDKKR